jgi:hypothetical protein
MGKKETRVVKTCPNNCCESYAFNVNYCYNCGRKLEKTEVPTKEAIRKDMYKKLYEQFYCYLGEIDNAIREITSNKPEPLTYDENKLIEKHSDILRASASNLDMYYICPICDEVTFITYMESHLKYRHSIYMGGRESINPDKLTEKLVRNGLNLELKPFIEVIDMQYVDDFIAKMKRLKEKKERFEYYESIVRKIEKLQNKIYSLKMYEPNELEERE